MPVTAKLSKRFYEVLGEDVANELVDWFNAVDATYRSDLRETNELNFERFMASVDQRFAEQNARIEKRFAQLEVRFETGFAEQDARFEKHFGELESRIELRFAEQDAKFEKRFGEQDAKFEKRFDEMKQAIALLMEHVADNSVIVLQGEEGAPLEELPRVAEWEERKP